MDVLTFRLVALAKKVNELFTKAEQQSVPAGGSTGQVLAKASNTDFSLSWVTPQTIAVGPTPPSNPTINDLWVDTN